MNKQDIINEIISELNPHFDTNDIILIKNAIIVKLLNVDITPKQKYEISTEVKDNDFILQRFIIDCAASSTKESTIKQYAFVIKKFLDETNLNYFDVTAQDITDYLAVRQYRDKISNGYKVTIYKRLCVFFKWAYRKHHIEEDVCRELDRVKSYTTQKIRLTDEEVEQCRFAVTTKKERALLELMLSTGMRVGEISKLQIKDLMLAENKIRIWGEKSNQFRPGFITPSCKVALQDYLGNRKEGYVFQSKRSSLGNLDIKTLENIAKTIAIKANIEKNCTVHIYRKTFASITFRRTGDILLVSKLLGHASPETTAKYYICDDTQEMLNTMQKIC